MYNTYSTDSLLTTLHSLSECTANSDTVQLELAISIRSGLKENEMISDNHDCQTDLTKNVMKSALLTSHDIGIWFHKFVF